MRALSLPGRFFLVNWRGFLMLQAPIQLISCRSHDPMWANGSEINLGARICTIACSSPIDLNYKSIGLVCEENTQRVTWAAIVAGSERRIGKRDRREISRASQS